MVKAYQTFGKSLKTIQNCEKEYLTNISNSNSDGINILKDFVKMRLSAEETYVNSLKKFQNIGLKFLADTDAKKVKGTNDTLVKRFLATLLSTITCRLKCVQEYMESMQHSYFKIIENLDTLNGVITDTVNELLDNSVQQCTDIIPSINSCYENYEKAFEKERNYFQKNKKYANPANRLNPKTASKLQNLQTLADTSDRCRCEYNMSYIAYMKLANDVRDTQVPKILNVIKNTFDPYFFALMDLFFRNEHKFSTNLNKGINEIYRGIDISNDEKLIVNKWFTLCAPYDKQFMQTVEILPSDSTINLKKSGLSEIETKQTLGVHADALNTVQNESENYLAHSREKFAVWKDYCRELSKVEPGGEIQNMSSDFSQFTLFMNTNQWIKNQQKSAILDAKVEVLNVILNLNNEKNKGSKTSRFGINLARDCQELNVDLPFAVVNMMTYIAKNGKDSIGIFKQASSKVEVDKIMNRLDDGKSLLNSTDVYVVANVLKIYLTELKNFIPRIALDDLLTSTAGKSSESKLELCANFINSLNSYSSRLLIKLLTFFKIFADNAKTNNMTASELSGIFVKHLFHLESFEDTGILKKPYENILTYMITNSERLARRKTSSKSKNSSRTMSQKAQRNNDADHTFVKSMTLTKKAAETEAPHSYNYIEESSRQYPSNDTLTEQYGERKTRSYYYDDLSDKGGYEAPSVQPSYQNYKEDYSNEYDDA